MFTSDSKKQNNKSFTIRLREVLSKTSVLPILVVVWIIFSIISPVFFSIGNAQTLLAATAVIAIAAIGETLVLITAGIDLSVASVAACAGVVSAYVIGPVGDPLTGLLIALGIGLVFGVINGVSVAYLGLTPFILTLGTYLIARGIAFSVSEGISLGVPQSIRLFGSSKFFGIPLIAIVAISLMIIFGLILTKTTWGRHVYLVGTNPSAADYVGIRRKLIIFSVYSITGLLSGLAGYMAVANLGAALPGVGDKILLIIIGGVILGGTSMFGGSGSIGKTALGILLLASLTNGLNLLGFDFYDQLIAQGIVIVLGTAMIVWTERTRKTD